MSTSTPQIKNTTPNITECSTMMMCPDCQSQLLSKIIKHTSKGDIKEYVCHRCGHSENIIEKNGKELHYIIDKKKKTQPIEPFLGGLNDYVYGTDTNQIPKYYVDEFGNRKIRNDTF